jgi:hypothetical protein
MSLPTYIRQRRQPDPALYLAEKLGPEFAANLQAQISKNPQMAPQAIVNEMTHDLKGAALWNRVMQMYNQWKTDFAGYYINPTKRHVRPFWLVPTNELEQTLVLSAAGFPGDRVNGIAFDVDTQGHFEITYNMFQASSPNFLVTIADGGNNGKLMMNSEIHARTIAGNAQRPLILPESYLLNVQNAKRTLIMGFRNLFAGTNSVRWCFHGRRWYHKEAPPNVQRAIEDRFGLMEKTYTYYLTLTQNPPSLNPNTPEGANMPGLTLSAFEALFENSAPYFTATDEADTEVHKLTATADGPFEFQLREKSSGRTLSNGFIRAECGWGDGQYPFVWAETFLIERNCEVMFEVRDLSGLRQNIIYPTLIGRRLQYA